MFVIFHRFNKISTISIAIFVVVYSACKIPTKFYYRVINRDGTSPFREISNNQNIEDAFNFDIN